MPTDFRIVSTMIQPGFMNWGQQLAQLPKVWQVSRGRDVRVAVIDSGIAMHHPDLVHAIGPTRDFSRSPTGVADDHGHGTHVAGIIAAKDDGQGVVGIAPESQLVIGKVLRAPGFPLQQKEVAEAMRWAVKEEGARIVCLSLSWNEPVPLVEAAIQEVVDLTPPVIVVCAAGNRSQAAQQVQFPAAYPETLAVGYVAAGPNGLPVVTADSVTGTPIDLVAPGANVLSTFPPAIYAAASGTSMAAPFVAGTLALLVEHRRKRGQTDADIAKVRDLLQRTSRDLALSGRDKLTGWGLIDPRLLLEDPT